MEARFFYLGEGSGGGGGCGSGVGCGGKNFGRKSLKKERIVQRPPFYTRGEEAIKVL